MLERAARRWASAALSILLDLRGRVGWDNLCKESMVVVVGMVVTVSKDISLQLVPEIEAPQPSESPKMHSKGDDSVMIDVIGAACNQAGGSQVVTLDNRPHYLTHVL